MALGGLFIVIGLPFLFVWLMGERKHNIWRNLGFIAIGFGLFIIVTGLLLYFTTN